MHQPLKPRRSVSYPCAGATAVIPTELWRESLEILRSYGKDGSEGLVFWGGVVAGDCLQITGLYAPRHRPQGLRVRLAADESRWLLRLLRERDEKLVAQVHSHSDLAFHSDGDEERAASFHSGFLSIVVPHFGVGVERLEDCAVFEYDGKGFIELDHQLQPLRIRHQPWLVLRT